MRRREFLLCEILTTVIQLMEVCAVVVGISEAVIVLLGFWRRLWRSLLRRLCGLLCSLLLFQPGDCRVCEVLLFGVFRMCGKRKRAVRCGKSSEAVVIRIEFLHLFDHIDGG